MDMKEDKDVSKLVTGFQRPVHLVGNIRTGMDSSDSKDYRAIKEQKRKALTTMVKTIRPQRSINGKRR